MVIVAMLLGATMFGLPFDSVLQDYRYWLLLMTFVSGVILAELPILDIWNKKSTLVAVIQITFVIVALILHLTTFIVFCVGFIICGNDATCSGPPTCIGTQCPDTRFDGVSTAPTLRYILLTIDLVVILITDGVFSLSIFVKCIQETPKY